MFQIHYEQPCDYGGCIQLKNDDLVTNVVTLLWLSIIPTNEGVLHDMRHKHRCDSDYDCPQTELMARGVSY